MRVTHVTYEAKGWGVGELWLDGDRLLQHELPTPNGSKGGGSCALSERFRAYFAGARDDFLDVEVDADWATPFQEALADALRSIPYGDTVTYGELAALAGRPRAARAAGTFCAHNRFSLVIPCHRVVAAGDLGSYGSLGIGYKQRLLRHEGVAV